MTHIKNTQNIEQITMRPTAITKCAIGQDWYQNDFEINFIPTDCYPDYMEIQDWIMENIDGHELNIEDVVYKIKTFLEQEYHPDFVMVKDRVRGNKVHFDVDVTA